MVVSAGSFCHAAPRRIARALADLGAAEVRFAVTAMSDQIRRTTDPATLEEIHRRGVGYVFSPFNRTVHVAGCPQAGTGASRKQPKVFAPNEASAVAYQRSRLADYSNAQPFRRVPCCADAIATELLVDGDRSDAPGSGDCAPETFTARGAVRTGAPPGDRSATGTADWFLSGPTPDESAVELWTTRRLPFTSDQDADQKDMVASVSSAIRRLGAGAAGERMSGLFASDDLSGRQPDAENITFYNFGAAAFGLAPPIVSFERSYSAPPEPARPLRSRASYYHRWTLDPADAPWTTWRVMNDPVAEWSGISLPVIAAEHLGLHAWLALRTQPSHVGTSGRLRGDEPFAVVVEWSVPEPRRVKLAVAVKGLVDGPLAALQRADDLPDPVVERLLGRRWSEPMSRERLLDLVQAHEPGTVLPRAPFNQNGLDPCDERCVAGLVSLTRSIDGRATLSGRLVRLAAS